MSPGPEQNDTGHRGNVEAQKLRARAKDAETARDDLTAKLAAASDRVEEVERRAVNRLAAARFAEPGDAWLFGGLFPGEGLPRDAEGHLDEAAVDTMLADLAARRPELTVAGRERARPRYGASARGQGQRGSTPPSATKWAEVFSRPR